MQQLLGKKPDSFLPSVYSYQARFMTRKGPGPWGHRDGEGGRLAVSCHHGSVSGRRTMALHTHSSFRPVPRGASLACAD